MIRLRIQMKRLMITDHFKMNTKTRETYLDNQLIEGLTPKEFDLLYTLAKNHAKSFSREQLLELVWDYQYFGDERTVDAHIKKLRQKLKNGSSSHPNGLGRRV